MIKEFIKKRLGTIIVAVLALGLVAWGAVSIQKARQNAITFDNTYQAPEGNRDLGDTGSYVSAAKNGSLELLYNEANGAIQVRNLESGYLWKSIADGEILDMEGLNPQWSAYAQSPITITYNDLAKRDASPATRYAGKDCTWLEAKSLDQGVAVTYGFLAAGIYVTVEYTLEDGQLVVRVPMDQIREESTFALTTLEVLPFLGAAGNDEDGYLFYPDGSGAITTYANSTERSSNVKSASYYTYTNRNVDFMTLYNGDSYDRYTAAMPVYGIKNDGDALFGIVTQGAQDSGVSVYPSGIVIDLNHIGFQLYIRNVFAVNMFNISGDDETVVTGTAIQRVDRNMIPGDREIRYYLLTGEDADYSGMARAYREYLTQTGQLADREVVSGEMPMTLELLMGVNQPGILFDEYVPMTTFEETEEILDSLREQGIRNTRTLLRSWVSADSEADGEYWPPAGGLGGKRGLAGLNDYAASNPGTKLYLEAQFTSVTSDTKGISETADVVYNGLNTEVSAANYNSGKNWYFLNPGSALERSADFLDKLGKYPNLNVAYQGLGMYAIPDYNDNAPYTKAETVEAMRRILSDTAQSGRSVGVIGANQYAYGCSDYLCQLRENSYGLAITDYAVPFLEMALSGKVAYATDGAGNLASDLQEQKLKWVEYGSMPYFILTSESAQELRESDYAWLFSSTFADWKDRVTEVWQEMEERLGRVYGQQITEHEILGQDLVRITYADGTQVYINYAREERIEQGVLIPGQDYVVVEGGNRK